MAEDQFNGEIRVASKIVDYLSSGLYESPAACLKELINNSYDADATRVNVYVKPDADRIIIEDDGHGMNRQDFVRHFSVISESFKRESSDVTEFGRPKIGKIGIGFIAANEICDVMEIISTKEGSDEQLNVVIDFDLMRKDKEERLRDEDRIAKADYEGTIKKTDIESHYTQIYLKKIRGEAKAILAGVAANEFSAGNKSLYGLSPSSVYKRLSDPKLSSWSQFDTYSRNMLEVALNVPVQYHDGWIPRRLLEKVHDVDLEAKKLGFSAFFDGSELRKPIVFSSNSTSIVRRFEHFGDQVSAAGYFYAQHGAIKPQELQGVLIRIRNAAIGGYDQNFMGFSNTIGPLFQTWISGEIFADDRLESAMNIDRKTLRVSHPAYVELQRAIHLFLARFIAEIREDIYGEASKSRKKTRAKDVKDGIVSAFQKETNVSKEARKNVEQEWGETLTTKSGEKMLLQKYRVDEIYEIVMDVAKGLLDQKQFEEFLEKLTERLRG